MPRRHRSPEGRRAAAGPAAAARGGARCFHHGGTRMPKPACSRSGAASREEALRRRRRRGLDLATAAARPAPLRGRARAGRPGRGRSRRCPPGSVHRGPQRSSAGPSCQTSLGRDEEARVVGRLEEDLDPPRLVVGAVFVVGSGGGDEPEAGAQRPGGRRARCAASPAGRLQLLDVTRVVGVGRDRGVVGGEGGQECLGGGELLGPPRPEGEGRAGGWPTTTAPRRRAGRRGLR